ncbi:hypothetical protein J6590_039403 [Homalodisca vitripennis]|nr:hypothetical protein J6590_039403 [Homalodisca vitripennis]
MMDSNTCDGRREEGEATTHVCSKSGNARACCGLSVYMYLPHISYKKINVLGVMMDSNTCDGRREEGEATTHVCSKSGNARACCGLSVYMYLPHISYKKINVLVSTGRMTDTNTRAMGAGRKGRRL